MTRQPDRGQWPTGRLLSTAARLVEQAWNARLREHGVSHAGMIVLAGEILDGRPDQEPLRAIDIVVRRNAFGRQVDSFETDLELDGVPGGPMRAVFIRAPWVEQVGPGVQVLARVGEHPVAVRQGPVLATSFHPEVAGDDRLHALFLTVIASG